MIAVLCVLSGSLVGVQVGLHESQFEEAISANFDMMYTTCGLTYVVQY